MGRRVLWMLQGRVSGQMSEAIVKGRTFAFLALAVRGICCQQRRNIERDVVQACMREPTRLRHAPAPLLGTRIAPRVAYFDQV